MAVACQRVFDNRTPASSPPCIGRLENRRSRLRSRWWRPITADRRVCDGFLFQFDLTALSAALPDIGIQSCRAGCGPSWVIDATVWR